jgi:hypothetical protein
MSNIDFLALRMFRVAYQQHAHKKDLTIDLIDPGEEIVERIKSLCYESGVSSTAPTLANYAALLS